MTVFGLVSAVLPDTFNHVAFILRFSLATNVIIVAVTVFFAITSGSLALISTVAENAVDLFVQTLLWWAGTNSNTIDYARYPAGKSRYEPVFVLVAASLMGAAAVLIIQESIIRLVKGFSNGEIQVPVFFLTTIIFIIVAVLVKAFIWLYGLGVARSFHSASVKAVSDDCRNDVFSNSFAVAAYALASANPELWYLDSLGALIIFVLISISWGLTAREQVLQLVGISANQAFINKIKELSSLHSSVLQPDIVRAYHFGSNYLVEIEAVLPADMSVKEAHEIAVALQFKLEKLDNVERAFVHIDYQRREYDEHLVSKEADAVSRYVDLSGEVL